jgi:hypothetical protein
MTTFLKEDIFGRLLKVLKDELKKDVLQYSYIMENKPFNNTAFSFFDDYLSEKDIMFCKKGISLDSLEMLPASMSLECDEIPFSSGIYFIHPDTDKEIIICFFHYMQQERRSSPHYIICYRKQDVLDFFLSDYKKFYIEKHRCDNKIFVYGASDIPIPILSWDDIILPEALKNDIRQSIESFIYGEQVYIRLKIPYKRGFLFAGPPGNGKTMLMKAIASNYPSWKFLKFTPSATTDNSDIDEVFKDAERFAPSILCFEDLDTLFKHQVSMSHFLNKLDGFEDRNGTLVLATTNHPEDIDPALTSRPSRFDRVWVINNPDSGARKSFIKKYFNGSCSDGFTNKLIRSTDGFSMAYLKELYISAAILAINSGIDSPGEYEVTESLKTLSSQIEVAKHHFVGPDNIKKIGFGA